MLQLRIFGASQVIASVSKQLEVIPGSAHVILTANGESAKSLVTADLDEDAVDPALAEVQRLGVPKRAENVAEKIRTTTSCCCAWTRSVRRRRSGRSPA